MSGNVFGHWLNTTFGFRGRQNILSWAVAGGLAYYFFYLPEQRKAAEVKVRATGGRKRKAVTDARAGTACTPALAPAPPSPDSPRMADGPPRGCWLRGGGLLGRVAFRAGLPA